MRTVFLALLALVGVGGAAWAEDVTMGTTMPAVAAADLLSNATNYFTVAIGVGLTLFVVILGIAYVPKIINKLRGR